jgi:hypothetical protein
MSTANQISCIFKLKNKTKHGAVLLFYYRYVVAKQKHSALIPITAEQLNMIAIETKIATCKLPKKSILEEISRHYLLYLMNTLINTMLILFTPKETIQTDLKRKSAHKKKALLIKKHRTTNFKIFKKTLQTSKNTRYAMTLVHNYALTAEEHYYNIRYFKFKSV